MKKKYIICVDDEKIVLDSLQKQLNRHFENKFSYEFAESAEEALEIIEDIQSPETIVIVISDWLMPNMKGDEFLLKIHEELPEVHKFMLTGQVDSDAITKLITKLDNFVVFQKPWDEDKLIETISKKVNI